jgi:hypothetical protein
MIDTQRIDLLALIGTDTVLKRLLAQMAANTRARVPFAVERIDSGCGRLPLTGIRVFGVGSATPKATRSNTS